MILGFKPQFVPGILGLAKIHTIREDKHKRWKKGMAIHFATGVRTKNYNCFMGADCQSVQEIEMDLSLNPATVHSDIIIIDNYVLLEEEMFELAKNDGFMSYESFKKWFLNMHGNIFKGRIIHWSNKRY